MATEVPSRKVITAIEDPDFESYVAQLLFSQGMNITHRSVNLDSYTQAIAESPIDDLALVVFRSDGEFKEELVRAVAEPRNFLTISLDGLPMNAHQIMMRIRSQSRLPLLQVGSREIRHSEVEKTQSETNNPTILVTGTAGSPGRSYLSVRLAQQLDQIQATELIDADLRQPSLAYLCGSLGLRLPLTVLNRSERPHQLPQMRDSQSLARVVDIGPLTSLEEVADDRRWHSHFLFNAIEQCSALIYVVHSSGLGLLRLESFMRDFPNFLRSTRILYLLNQSGVGKEDVAVRERFLSLTTGESQAILPKVDISKQSIASRARRVPLKVGGNPFDFEIARIARTIAA